MKKTLMLNKGLFISTMIVGIVAAGFQLLSNIIDLVYVLDNSSNVSWGTILVYILAFAACITLIVLTSIIFAKADKKKDESGRNLCVSYSIYAIIVGSFNIIKDVLVLFIGGISVAYFIALLIEIAVLVLGILSINFLDKKGNTSKILLLIIAFAYAIIGTINLFAKLNIIGYFYRMVLIAYSVLTIISLFMMKEKEEILEEPISFIESK